MVLINGRKLSNVGGSEKINQGGRIQPNGGKGDFAISPLLHSLLLKTQYTRIKGERRFNISDPKADMIKASNRHQRL